MQQPVTDTMLTIADSTLTEHDWKNWLEAYAALRTMEFIRLLETDRKEIAR